MGYDVLYQKWLSARKAKQYDLADSIRDQFEKEHGLTIFAEGEMPIEGVTTHRMTAAKWHKKYGKPEVAEAMERNQSKFGPMRIYI